MQRLKRRIFGNTPTLAAAYGPNTVVPGHEYTFKVLVFPSGDEASLEGLCNIEGLYNHDGHTPVEVVRGKLVTVIPDFDTNSVLELQSEMSVERCYTGDRAVFQFTVRVSPVAEVGRYCTWFVLITETNNGSSTSQTRLPLSLCIAESSTISKTVNRSPKTATEVISSPPLLPG